jgi:hypothetical protein
VQEIVQWWTSCKKKKKKRTVEMVKAFCGTNMAEKFETVPLSHHTAARRVAAMSGHMAGKLSDIVGFFFVLKPCNNQV